MPNLSFPSPASSSYSLEIIVSGTSITADGSQAFLFSDYPWATRVWLGHLGGGVGGGRGATGPAGANRLGGGGGGGGAYTIMEYSIAQLIAAGGDRILVFAGRGGAGDVGTSGTTQASSTNGGVGGHAYTQLRTLTTLIEVIAYASGGLGSGLTPLGTWSGSLVVAGTNGITQPNQLLVVGANQAGAPGSPGGGISNANVVGSAGATGIPGMYLYRHNASNTPVGNSSPTPWQSWLAGNGGYGGGARDTASGQNGGDGGPGCGGGGGGAVLNGFTSGSGGNGGPAVSRVVFLQ